MNVDDTKHLARALWKVRQHVKTFPARDHVVIDPEDLPGASWGKEEHVTVGTILDQLQEAFQSSIMATCAARVPRFDPELFLRIAESDKELEFEEKTGGRDGKLIVMKPKPCPVCEGSGTVGGLKCPRCAEE